MAARTAPTAATTATVAVTPPKRLETGTSGSRPDPPMNTRREAPGKSRIDTGATAKRKKAAPTAVSSPAKSSHREKTSFTAGPLRTVNAAVGGDRPDPTPKTVTPAIVWPSSDTTRQRTV